MRFLRTNTATRITVGPFFDKTDGVTPETAITVTSCKLTMMVDDGGVPTLVLDTNPTASGGANDMVHVTGDDAGFYDLELAAGNVNYVGRAMIAITDAATHCPVFHEFMIVPAMIYDSMFLGTDRLDVNATHVADTAQTARDLGASVLLSSGTGTGQLDFTAGVVKANVTQNAGSAITAASGVQEVKVQSIATDAITSAALASSAVSEIQSGLSTLDAAAVRTAVGLASANLDTQLSAIAGYIDTEVAAIKAKTDNLPSDPADASDIVASFSTVNSTLSMIAGYIDTEVAAIKAKTDSLTFTVAGKIDANVLNVGGTAQTAGDLAALLNTLAGYVDTEIAAIKAKTDSLTFTAAGKVDANVLNVAGTLQTAGDLAALLTTISGYLDTEIAAIKAKTDSLTFTSAGKVDANVKAVEDSTAAAANLSRGTLGTTLGTVGSGSTTTSIVTSSLDPAAAAADQFKGRIVTFDRGTTTVALRGQATDITASSSGGVLTVTALTVAPSSGDTFTIT